MKIIFYNNWHNGDIFVSREFIKYMILNQFNKYNFYYYHKNSDNLLKDLYSLKIIYEDIPPKRRKDLITMDLEKDIIYLNTWYRAADDKYFKEYGISLLTLFHLFQDIISKLYGYKISEEDIEDFIPNPEYESLLDINPINNFINSNNKRKVLISNNDVLSGQSLNFNFNPIILKLSEKFKDLDFFITNKSEDLCKADNVFYFEDLFPKEECNLNDIGYFSLFCNTIIGRLSGPMAFCYNFDNLTDKTKTFINFYHDNKMYQDGSFGMTTILPDYARAKFINSTNFEINNILNIIENEIK